MSSKEDGFIPPHGGYEKLISYQKALIVFDGTVFFVKKWLPARGDRTVDQMVQAARSGKQNIVEGSVASGTSKEMEIKLTNAARHSQEELKEDYEDFLRTRGLREWPETHRYAQRLRELNRQPSAVYADFQRGIENDDPEIAANVLLGLVKVTSFLLKRQIEALERIFFRRGRTAGEDDEGSTQETLGTAERSTGPKGQKGQEGPFEVVLSVRSVPFVLPPRKPAVHNRSNIVH